MLVSRDTKTFLGIIKANKGIIYKVANSYCRDDENRKDLIQEIMIQLWLSFGKYNEAYKLSTWMYRIALNVSISYYRKESRRDEINQPLPTEILYLAEEKNTGEMAEKINLLYRFIKDLKEIDRAIILLHLEENNHQEIADILGLSGTNVSTRLLRIKQQLKHKFSITNQ